MTCVKGLLRLLWGGPEVGVLRNCCHVYTDRSISFKCYSQRHTSAANEVYCYFSTVPYVLSAKQIVISVYFVKQFAMIKRLSIDDYCVLPIRSRQNIDLAIING